MKKVLVADQFKAITAGGKVMYTNAGALRR